LSAIARPASGACRASSVPRSGSEAYDRGVHRHGNTARFSGFALLFQVPTSVFFLSENSPFFDLNYGLANHKRRFLKKSALNRKKVIKKKLCCHHEDNRKTQVAPSLSREYWHSSKMNPLYIQITGSLP
jgi:hypothetical protein